MNTTPATTSTDIKSEHIIIRKLQEDDYNKGSENMLIVCTTAVNMIHDHSQDTVSCCSIWQTLEASVSQSSLVCRTLLSHKAVSCTLLIVCSFHLQLDSMKSKIVRTTSLLQKVRVYFSAG
jgi:hypothetical protein